MSRACSKNTKIEGRSVAADGCGGTPDIKETDTYITMGGV